MNDWAVRVFSVHSDGQTLPHMAPAMPQVQVTVHKYDTALD